MNHVTVDPPRRKRLKVVRACSVCRRRKQKCNGEQPCAPCLKTHSACQYTNTTNTNTKLVQRKQTQPLADSVSQMPPTTNTMNTKLLSTASYSISAPEVNHLTSSIETNSILSTSPSTDNTFGMIRHGIHSHTTSNNSRIRSPIRKPMTYTIQSIEQRLLEIEKALTILLQRHDPALPGLLLSSPSYSTSTDESLKTHVKDSVTTSSMAGVVSSSSPKISKELAFVDHQSPRINLKLPPLQSRPSLHDTASSSGGDFLQPCHDTKLFFDRKIPVLQPLLSRHQQDNKTDPGTVVSPHSPSYHYQHSPLHTITAAPLPSCIP